MSKMVDMERTCFECRYFPNCAILRRYGTDTDPERDGLLWAYGKSCEFYVKR